MRFCTAINCMDGRVQVPVIRYLQHRFRADYVDIVSEPGPNKIIAEAHDAAALESIRQRVRISVDNHKSVGIAVIGHHDCAGNPVPETMQNRHTKAAVQRIRNNFAHIPVIGLWVDENREVMEVQQDPSDQNFS